jgi:hypothetical protein
VRRLAVAIAALSGTLTAPVIAQAASRPPEIGLRLGAVTTDRVCTIGGRFAGTGPDGAAFAGSAKASVRSCRGFPALRVRRAQRLTITLRDPAAAIAATWYAGRATATIPVQPVGGQAPASTWVLSVPSVSGRLILGVSSPPGPAPNGGVWQVTTDYRVVVRRPPTPPPRPLPPVPPPEPPQTFDDRG